jgi:diadenosine tetraphosphatase ApaH/serine/threonine PP2A family protein phosphatase
MSRHQSSGRLQERSDKKRSEIVGSQVETNKHVANTGWSGIRQWLKARCARQLARNDHDSPNTPSHHPLLFHFEPPAEKKLLLAAR